MRRAWDGRRHWIDYQVKLLLPGFDDPILPLSTWRTQYAVEADSLREIGEILDEPLEIFHE